MSQRCEPLWFPDAGPGGHQRSPAGQKNPSPSHQDRSGPTGAVRRFLGLNLLSCFLLLRGSLRPLSQCPAPFDAHGHRLAPISCMPALPALSSFTHFLTFLAHNPLRYPFKRFFSRPAPLGAYQTTCHLMVHRIGEKVLSVAVIDLRLARAPNRTPSSRLLSIQGNRPKLRRRREASFSVRPDARR